MSFNSGNWAHRTEKETNTHKHIKQSQTANTQEKKKENEKVILQHTELVNAAFPRYSHADIGRKW